MFLVVLSLIALWCKPLKFPSTVEWIQNWGMFIHIHSYIYKYQDTNINIRITLMPLFS